MLIKASFSIAEIIRKFEKIKNKFMTHEVITTWEGNMNFHSTNPAGELYIDVAPEDGGDGRRVTP